MRYLTAVALTLIASVWLVAQNRDETSVREIEQLERAAGFARDDGPERKLEKLELLLAGSARDLGDVVPLVAALLSIPTGGRYPLLNLSPQRQ